MPEAPNSPPLRVAELQVQPLATEALRWRCHPEDLPYDSTESIEPLREIVGQSSAVEALRFGLETSAHGQNVYVRGDAGTGRLTLVRNLLKDTQSPFQPAPDRAYVHNFDAPARPRLITLARGSGPKFSEEIESWIDFIEGELSDAIQSQVTRSRKAEIDRVYAAKAKEVSDPFNTDLQERGLAVVTVQGNGVSRPSIVPLVDGQPMPPDQLANIQPGQSIGTWTFEDLEKAIEEFSARLEEISKEVFTIRTEHQAKLKELFQCQARLILQQRSSGIRAVFGPDAVGGFLDAVIEDVVRRIEELGVAAGFTPLYRVNLIQTSTVESERPVIIENVPSMRRLIGSLDTSTTRPDEPLPAHMVLRGGSLLGADGGYLVLDAREIATRADVWGTLVRTLRSGELELVASEGDPNRRAPSLLPDPIPIRVKVILTGDARLFAALERLDADFSNLFKVLVDLDSTIPRGPEAVRFYGGVIAKLARQEDLLPFDRSALAALLEHGSRIASQKDKLTSRFGRLADLAREAHFLAAKAERTEVTGEDVREAVRRTKRRASLPARKFLERIHDGGIRIQSQGQSIGEINGLAVIAAGPLRYGFPSRITTTVAPGTDGLISIDEEADLSGRIHTKGFQILRGLLRHLLRPEHPLAFEASIAFEQSYGGIDGDSASGAEFCCMASALAGIPIRQDLAITGAIDQVGNILPIGGVNEKIEGFYDVCAYEGLTGTQGVLIPTSNAGDLMLRQDIVDACDEGKFAIYAIDRIEQALALFTGHEPGRLDDLGNYAADTIFGRLSESTKRFWTSLKAKA